MAIVFEKDEDTGALVKRETVETETVTKLSRAQLNDIRLNTAAALEQAQQQVVLSTSALKDIDALIDQADELGVEDVVAGGTLEG